MRRRSSARPERREQLADVRLAHEREGVGIEPLDGGSHRGPLGHHDDFRLRRQPLELGQQGERGLGAGRQIDEQGVEGVAPDQLERLGDGGDRDGTIRARVGLGAEHAREVLIAVDDQQ